MSLFRKRSLPQASEPGSALSLPPVRMGLLTKLNLLTVALIFLTAAGTTGFYVWQQWRDETADLRQRGASALVMLSELSEFGLYTANRAYLEAVLASLPAEGDIAYAAIVDRKGDTVAVRRIADALGPEGPPPLATDAPLPIAGSTSAADVMIRGKRYVELIAPVSGAKLIATMGIDHVPLQSTPNADGNGASASPTDAGNTLGYVRVGMTFDRVQQQFRKHLVGAFSVIALLIGLTIGATFMLTRGLVAPMHRLMRAARAVGAGKLDVFVPPRSTDELGSLTHAFNHMTQRLAESQAEVADHHRTLEEKVAQRTHELEIATAHAYKLAQHDILTGLPNRALLNQRLKQILALSQRNGAHVACLFLDFDHFKRINDTLGHDSGDQLLQAVSQRLIAAVRESDTVARLGGDEFVVILPGLDPAHATFETMTVLARIRESFLPPFKLADQTPTLTCSIGVSMFPLDASDTVTLIKQADTAMYAAKEVGRNAYRFYTADMNARVQARLQLETDMRRGLVQNEFFLAYQPQVDLQTGRTRAVEALIRWRDPSRGVIPPSEFIPIAEESGMIHALGARVLRDACRQLVAWHRVGMMLRLSVNLSVQQLQHDSCVPVVDEALRASGLAPQYLDLEITESVIISHPEKAVATLVKLKERGISITVDDFGTGYSSLSYLATLPIEALKIDQRFVHGLEHNSNDVAITQAIIALSHSLGLRVIAEGVETRAQFSFLKNHGCESAQGFLIGRPLEEKDFLAWWKAQQDKTRSVTLQPDMWQPEGG